MIIRQLALFLPAEEIGRRLLDALRGVEQLGAPVVRLTDGGIELSGEFRAGLTLPFQTAWTAEARPDNRVALRLVRCSAGPFGGRAVAGQVLAMLAGRIGPAGAAQVEGECLVLALGPILATHGVELGGAVRGIDLTTAGADVTVS
jgi:hypothetical protein